MSDDEASLTLTTNFAQKLNIAEGSAGLQIEMEKNINSLTKNLADTSLSGSKEEQTEQLEQREQQERQKTVEKYRLELHKEAEKCEVENTAKKIRECKKNGILRDVINHRDEDGTNAVGKAFLAHPSDPRAIEIATLFAEKEEYKINSYLNNKAHMDFKTKEVTGGTTSLHNVIMCAAQMPPTEANITSLKKFFKALETRLTWDGNNFNPGFPAMCPALDKENKVCHMISTRNLLKFIFNKFTNANKTVKRLCYELCTNLIGRYLKKQEDDESGDSGVEESNAGHYKEMLLTIKLFPNRDSTSDQSSTTVQNASSTTATEGSTSSARVLTDDYLSYLNGLSEDDSHTESKDDINSMYVPLFHGVPLMQSQYTNQERREIGKKVEAINEKLLERFLKKPNSELTSVEKIMISIHSRTSTASAGLQSLQEVFRANQSKLNELNKKSETLQNKFKAQLNEDQKPVIKTYVESFANLTSEYFWTKMFGQNYPAGIVKYRFPIIATSKAVDHAFRFAIGRNVEGSKGETQMNPEYDQTGHPKHRLAGLLYVTLHKLSDIVKGRIEGSVIDFNSDIGTTDFRRTPQLECDFFGKIDADKVICILPIIYPSIRSDHETGFQPDYHDGIFKLSSKIEAVNGDRNTSKVKAGLWECPNPEIIPDTHLAGFGLMFVPAYANLANGLLSRIATMEQKRLVTVQTDRTLIRYDTKEWMGSTSEQFSVAQKDLKANDKVNNPQDRVWWTIAKDLPLSNTTSLNNSTPPLSQNSDIGQENLETVVTANSDNPASLQENSALEMERLSFNEGVTNESKITGEAYSNKGATDKENSNTNEENPDNGVTADSNMPDNKEDEENSNKGEPGQNED